MVLLATSDVTIRFVGFDRLDDELANVRVSFDEAEFTFATNAHTLDAEPAIPEYGSFIKRVVAGDEFDEENDQHIECAARVADRGLVLASAYAEACWKLHLSPPASWVNFCETTT